MAEPFKFFFYSGIDMLSQYHGIAAVGCCWCFFKLQMRSEENNTQRKLV